TRSNTSSDTHSDTYNDMRNDTWKKIMKNKGEEDEKISICRVITEKESIFKVNGVSSTLSEVRELVSLLGIHVDNLGQFLPQDKVSEFSFLSPEEQLELTVKTCNPLLIKRKKDLDQINDLLEKSQKKSQIEASKIKEKETYLLLLQEELKKIEEIIEHKRVAELVEGKLLWMSYNSLKVSYDELKKKREEKKKIYAEESKRVEILKNKIKEEEEKYLREKEEQEAHWEEQLEEESFTAAVEHIKEYEKKQKAIEEEIQKLEQNKISLQEEKEQAIQWIKGVKSEKEPENKFTEEKQILLSQLEEQHKQEQIKDSEWQVQSIMKAEEMKRIEIQMRKEEEQETSALKRLETLHKDTYTAVMKIKEDPRLWDIELPAILTLTLKKEEFATELSSQLSVHALTTFVCRSQEAFHKVVKEFKEKQKLSINAVQVQPPSYAPQEPPLIDKKYNMTYLSECISGPPGVIEFLNIFSRLSHIPVTHHPINELLFFKENQKITRAISKKKVIEIKRSKYTTDTPLIIYPMHRGADIKSKEKTRILKEHLEDLRAKREVRTKERESILKKRLELEKEILSLSTLKDQQKKILDIHHRKVKALNSFKERVHEIENELLPLKTKQKEISNTLLDLKEKEKQLWTSLRPPNYAVILKSILISSKSLKHKEISLNASHVQAQREEQSLEHARKELEDTTQSIIKKEKEAKGKLKEAEEKTKITEETKEEMKALPKTEEELLSLLAKEKARIELLVADPSVIQEYQKEKEIHKISQEKHKKEKQEESNLLSKKEEEEKEIKKEISQIVEKVNEHAKSLFAKASVRVNISAELSGISSKWKLLFKVQFRKEGDLQILSPERQSGGEKCVCIILFLLSIQRVTSSPFVLVDEINQGMDANHERTIHRILLGEDDEERNQTLVITPKLVTQLEYAPSTKIHVIVPIA
ncbi:structural maintenance of chromosomes protein 5, partial [Nematocida sp. LUAm2]